MKVFKLRYPTKEIGIADLLAKGLLLKVDNDGKETIIEGQHNLGYYCSGILVDAQATFDAKGEELTPSTFLEGYHIDVMIHIPIEYDEKGEELTHSISDLYDFNDVEVHPKNSRHNFAIKKINK